jgi:hypothetical protein
MRTIKWGNIYSIIINNNLELQKLEHYQYSTIIIKKFDPKSD